MVDIHRSINDSLSSAASAERRIIHKDDNLSPMNDNCKPYGKGVNQGQGTSHAFRQDRNDSNERNHHNSSAITDGDAIVSKYGTENVGFEEGISFSYASSVFYSNMAQSDTSTGGEMDPSLSLACVDEGKHHQIHRQPVQQHRNPGSSNQFIVNPYVRSAQKNILKSTRCRSVSSKSELHFGLSRQGIDENRHTQHLNSKQNSSLPMSKSMALSSSLLGGVDIDFGDGLCNHEEQKDAYEEKLSTYEPCENETPRHLLHYNGTQDQENQSRPQGLLAVKNVPFAAALLYTRQEPDVQHLTMKTRPKTSRKTIQVNHLFSPPVSNFWSNKYDSFNHMQSELADVLVHSDENVVVSAPTGAGKTAVFEMAIGRLLRGFGQEDEGGGINMKDKVVYISPSKALCDERFYDWSQCLLNVHSNLKCIVATGDRLGSSSNSSLQELSESTLILTTPEKWDSITRNWRDNITLLASVKLLLIDEVHLLGDENRGGCLESVICRMKTIQRATCSALYTSKHSGSTGAEIPPRYGVTSKTLRIVSLSATLPNIEDIAAFIGAGAAYSFDSSYRPVPLITHVIGLGYSGKNVFMFDKNMGKEIPGLLRRFSNGKPAIVFCHTKKQTETLALELISTYGYSNPGTIKFSKQTNLSLLRKCIENGIAYHHSGMESECRQLVEKAFLSGMVKCLCATSTLAMGVNLPAHLVIIKGTKVWRGSRDGYQDIDSGTLLQMIGRAGRAGFDQNGTAIILTDKKSKTSYERITSGTIDVVESKLLKNLTETLNTEIFQRVISDTETAIKWLMDTFLFVRMRRNPKRYGVPRFTEMNMKEYLTKICNDSILDLHQNGIISICGKGQNIEPRRACQIMSRHLVPFSAMKLIMRLPYNSSELQILQMLSKLEGLQFPVRKAEKSKLNAAHKIVKYKIDGSSKFRIQTSEQKAFVLLQCAIGQYYLEDYTLRQEMSLAVEFASRMLLAAEDYSKEESKNGQVVFECMVMRRCLATSLWSSNDGVLNQIVGVGQVTTAKLLAAGIKTFDDVISKSGREIEDACGREAPFGEDLRTAASKLLARRLQVKTHLKQEDKKQKSVLTCDLTCSDDSFISDNGSANIVKYSLIVYTDLPGGLLTFESDIVRPGVYKIDCPSDCCRLYVKLISNIVGLDTSMDIIGGDNDDGSQVSLSPVKRRNMQNKRNVSSENRNGSQVCFLSCEDSHKDSDTNTTEAITLSDFQEREEKKANLFCNAVTPSPSLHRPSLTNRVMDTSKKTRSSELPKAQCKMVTGREFDTSYRMKKVWKRQQRDLQRSQQRAFSSQKDNPFSSFQYDPNDCEKHLIEQSRVLRDKEKHTIFLNNHEDQTVQRKRPLTLSENRVAFAKGWHVAAQSYKRGKSVSSGTYMTPKDLLHLKAQEQEAYTKELINHRIVSQNYGINVPNAASHHQSRLSQASSFWHTKQQQLLHECKTNNDLTIARQPTPRQMEKQVPQWTSLPRDSHCVRSDETMGYDPCMIFSPNAMFSDNLTKGNLEEMPLSGRNSIHDCSGVFQEDFTPQGMVITVKSDVIDNSKCSTSFPNEFDDAFIL